MHMLHLVASSWVVCLRILQDFPGPLVLLSFNSQIYLLRSVLDFLRLFLNEHICLVIEPRLEGVGGKADVWVYNITFGLLSSYRKIPPAAETNQIAGKTKIPPAHE